MSEEHQPLTHEPAPPGPRFQPPAVDQVARGAALAAFAVGGGLLGVRALRTSWLLTPVAAVFGVAALLSGWAAAIHITGGEKFDDHPFV